MTFYSCIVVCHSLLDYGLLNKAQLAEFEHNYNLLKTTIGCTLHIKANRLYGLAECVICE